MNTLTNAERETLNILSIGADGIRSIMETVTENMTYERALALTAELAQAGGTSEDDTRLDRMLWLVRWAYISGYYSALVAYDEAISNYDGSDDKLTVEAEDMTDEEYANCVNRVLTMLKFSDKDGNITPRRVYNEILNRSTHPRYNFLKNYEKLNGKPATGKIAELYVALQGIVDHEYELGYTEGRRGETE